MTTSNPVAEITADGVSAPTYDEVLDYLQEGARAIFGSDINLDADTQDGQLLAIFAKAISDTNSAIVNAYNSYNPTTATGIALDGAVKVNGLERHAAARSTVDLTLVGQAGTVITGAQASDPSGNLWDIPDCSIPSPGEVTVTATANKAGAINAAVGAVSTIATPIIGWQTVTNRNIAVPGNAAETDAALRSRQTISTMSPGSSLWGALVGAIANLDGVTGVAGKSNDSGKESEDGIPAHSIAFVVEGGSVADIAQTIYKGKSQGVSTYGDVSATFDDDFGNDFKISFSRPKAVAVKAVITVAASETWLSTEQDDIKERLMSYIKALGIGQKVDLAKCAAAIIKHDNGEYDEDFAFESLTLNGESKSVSIAWNERAAISAEDISITVN